MSSNNTEKMSDLSLSDITEDEPRPLGRTRRSHSLYGASPTCRFGPKGGILKSQISVLTIQDPGSQRLTWHKPPLSVLIIKKIYDDTIIPPFVELVLWLVQENKMVVFLETKVLEEEQLKKHAKFNTIRTKVTTFKEEEEDLTDKIDLIITLGGDGTLLYASTLFQQSVPPIMAFHFGSLGFLSPFDYSKFKDKVSDVLKGNVPLSLRTRLKCTVSTKDHENLLSSYSIKNEESKHHILVLNEVIVDRGPSPFICNVDLYIEKNYITTVQGDGVIISTPTGSTAYAASAGASMVHPNVPAIVIAPICPHSLSFRPIIVPAGVEIQVKINEEARNNAWVSFDGRNRQELTKGGILRISTSKYPIPSICFKDQMSDWFESLSSCLHWNVRKIQKGLPHVASTDSMGWSSNESTNGESR